MTKKIRVRWCHDPVCDCYNPYVMEHPNGTRGWVAVEDGHWFSFNYADHTKDDVAKEIRRLQEKYPEAVLSNGVQEEWL